MNKDECCHRVPKELKAFVLAISDIDNRHVVKLGKLSLVQHVFLPCIYFLKRHSYNGSVAYPFFTNVNNNIATTPIINIDRESCNSFSDTCGSHISLNSMRTGSTTPLPARTPMLIGSATFSPINPKMIFLGIDGIDRPGVILL